jgi:hypothetical protein
MQLRKVVSWLSMHNFPYGVVSFADGISTDPLRHKTEYLRGRPSFLLARDPDSGVLMNPDPDSDPVFC